MYVLSLSVTVMSYSDIFLHVKTTFHTWNKLCLILIYLFFFVSLESIRILFAVVQFM